MSNWLNCIICAFSPHSCRNRHFCCCNNPSVAETLTRTDTELLARLWSIEFDSFLELNMFMSSVTSRAIFLQDGNGYIDEQELDALLKDLCDKNKMVTSLLMDLFGLLFYI